jgi:hypothetical protein
MEGVRRLVYEIQYGLNETTLTVDDGKGYYCEGVHKEFRNIAVFELLLHLLLVVARVLHDAVGLPSLSVFVCGVFTSR